jgi:hypothetical protein
MRPHRTLIATALLLLTTSPAQDQGKSPGYTDTPLLPGSSWHVHDPARPQPMVVAPPPPGTPVPAPQDAIVLFDGRGLDEFEDGKGGKARWQVADGCMEVNRTGDITTVRTFGDCQLHIEWMAPAEVRGSSQQRGNSGVFFMGRYEVQVLDSYDNVTYADGQAAALYGQFPPLVNACRKPGEWQSYDIVFRAPVFDGDALVAPSRVTVFHNGVLVHLDQPLLGPTAHRSLPRWQPHEPKGPIRLQDHGDPVRFRNIWVRELELARPVAAPK